MPLAVPPAGQRLAEPGHVISTTVAPDRAGRSHHRSVSIVDASIDYRDAMASPSLRKRLTLAVTAAPFGIRLFHKADDQSPFVAQPRAVP